MKADMIFVDHLITLDEEILEIVEALRDKAVDADQKEHFAEAVKFQQRLLESHNEIIALKKTEGFVNVKKAIEAYRKEQKYQRILFSEIDEDALKGMTSLLISLSSWISAHWKRIWIS